MVGKSGDVVLSPFQCDLCWFRNLRKRDPVKGNLGDENLMAYIRWVNLDVLWGSETYTVAPTRRYAAKGISICKGLCILPSHLELGPWPVNDKVGFTVVL